MDRKIQDAIQKLAGTYKLDGVQILFGQVTEVDLNNTVINAPACTVSIKNDVPLINVALQSAFCDGFMLVPTVGSQVIVMRSQNGAFPFLIQASDLDAIYMQVADSWLVNWGSSGEDSDFTSKSYGGLVKIVDPNNPNVGLLAKINQLEQKYNSLLNLLNSHQHLSAVVGNPTGSPIVPFTDSINPVTSQDDLENKLITHGT